MFDQINIEKIWDYYKYKNKKNAIQHWIFFFQFIDQLNLRKTITS